MMGHNSNHRFTHDEKERIKRIKKCIDSVFAIIHYSKMHEGQLIDNMMSIAYDDIIYLDKIDNDK